MNIVKLITALQQTATASTSILDMMILGKAIEKLKLGVIVTVSSSANLPTNLTTNGNIYYVISNEELYYNVGSTWKRFYSIISPSAYAWGQNSVGQLGDNTATARQSPVTVVGGITNWSQVSAGGYFSLGLTTAGIAYAWGENSVGQLGDGTTTSRRSPVTVVGGITNWSQLAAGSYHSLGRTTAGIAYAWGRNDYGQLGNGGSGNQSSPITVVGGITNWSQISAGRVNTLALTSAGIAYGWGRGSNGVIGDGTTTNRSSPVTVVGGITTWAEMSHANLQSLGRTTAGILYAWGRNEYGEVGDNTITNRSSPVTVVGGITTWSQISAGGAHSLGRTSSGIAYAWGLNSSGQLGDGTTTSRRSPVTVVGGITNWSQLAGGLAPTGNHSLGLTSAGIAYGWGSGTATGGGTPVNNRSAPWPILGGINWTQISAGNRHSLGIQVSFSTQINNAQSTI